MVFLELRQGRENPPNVASEKAKGCWVKTLSLGATFEQLPPVGEGRRRRSRVSIESVPPTRGLDKQEANITEFCSIDRVAYPLPCQQSYMRWSAHSLPPLDTVSQGRRESGLQQMHPEALQNVRKRAFEMLDAGMNCVEIARKLSAHPQTIRKWKKHRETFGEELSVIGLKRGPKKLRPEVL